MQGLNLCTLAAAALLMIRQDSLAGVSARPRCPGLSALPRIKHLTLLQSGLGHSLAVTPLELPCPPSQPSTMARGLKKHQQGGYTQNEGFYKGFFTRIIGSLLILDPKVHLRGQDDVLQQPNLEGVISALIENKAQTTGCERSCGT